MLSFYVNRSIGLIGPASDRSVCGVDSALLRNLGLVCSVDDRELLVAEAALEEPQ